MKIMAIHVINYTEILNTRVALLMQKYVRLLRITIACIIRSCLKPLYTRVFIYMNIDIDNKALTTHDISTRWLSPNANAIIGTRNNKTDEYKRGSLMRYDNDRQFRHNVRKITSDCDDLMSSLRNSCVYLTLVVRHA